MRPTRDTGEFWSLLHDGSHLSPQYNLIHRVSVLADNDHSPDTVKAVVRLLGSSCFIIMRHNSADGNVKRSCLLAL